MSYLTPAQLLPELGHPQENVVWGQDVFPAEARILEIIAANSRIIDNACRHRYHVPFDPVPDDVMKICLSLCLADLLPTVHRGQDNDQHDRARFEYQKAKDWLNAIKADDVSLDAAELDGAVVAGGPVIVSSAATDRIFSVEDEH